MLRLITCLSLVLVGCLPEFEDACTDDSQCEPGRRCLSGVCVPGPPVDVGPDVVAPPDAADGHTSPTDAMSGLDGSSPADMNTRDGGPAHDAAADAVAEAGPDAEPDATPCIPIPGMCNRLDDDCDGLVDEASEAAAECGAAPSAAAMCVEGECRIACPPGASPIEGDPAAGCRRGCTLIGEWVRIAGRLVKDEDPLQRVVLAARDDLRFVALYDIAADRRDRLIKSYSFPAPAADEVASVGVAPRAEDVREAYLTGVSAQPIADRFVISAVKRWEDDTPPSTVFFGRSDVRAGSAELTGEWPQSPAITTSIGGDGVVTFIETLDPDSDPPMGALHIDRPRVVDGGPARAWGDPVTPIRSVGPEDDAAFTDALGYGYVSDVRARDGDGDETWALRYSRFDMRGDLFGEAMLSLPGPIVDRVTVTAMGDDHLALAAIGGEEVFQWVALTSDGPGFDPNPLVARWHEGPPIDARALALPGGPAVIYRGGDRARLVLPDPMTPAVEAVAFRGDLPASSNKVRSVDARVADDGRTLEVVMLRETGGAGVLEYGRYDCH